MKHYILSNYGEIETQKACRIFYEKEEVHERRKIITKLEENKNVEKKAFDLAGVEGPSQDFGWCEWTQTTAHIMVYNVE